MTYSKKLFVNYPHIQPNQDMNTTHFWDWLDQGYEVFAVALEEYLKNYGFDLETMKISTEQLELHRITHNHYWWTEVNNKC